MVGFTGTCLDCGVPILARSKRCRPCNGRVVGRAMALSSPRKRARKKGAYCTDCGAEICLGATRCKPCNWDRLRGKGGHGGGPYDGVVFHRSITPERALLDQARKQLMETWKPGVPFDENSE